MPSLDGEYRRHPRPEYRLHYSGDVGRLLVGYDKVCRFVNVRTIEEALAARLKDHQSPADGKQDEPTLSRLDLSGVVVPGSHVHALVCAILARGPELRPPGITALTTLVLDGCRIGDHGVAEIARLLHPDGGIPLASLHLAQNDIEGPGLLALSEVIPINATLRALRLDLNDRIESGGWVILCHALAVKHLSAAGLQTLSLVGCGLRPTVCPHLASLLTKRGPGLRHLDVSWNELGPAGVKSISTALRAGASATLRACSTLASLGFESVGLGFLSRALELPDARATHEAVSELCAALASLPALTSVTIGGNGLSEADAAQLVGMLEDRSAAQRADSRIQPLGGLSVDLTLPGELFAKLCRVPGAGGAGKKGKTKKKGKGKRK